MTCVRKIRRIITFKFDIVTTKQLQVVGGVGRGRVSGCGSQRRAFFWDTFFFALSFLGDASAVAARWVVGWWVGHQRCASLSLRASVSTPACAEKKMYICAYVLMSLCRASLLLSADLICVDEGARLRASIAVVVTIRNRASALLRYLLYMNWGLFKKKNFFYYNF